MIDTAEIDEIEKPKRGRPARIEQTHTVILKKAVFIDGVQLGNPGGVVEVNQETYEKLKASRVI